MANLEICKACKLCDAFPKAMGELTDADRRVYHCLAVKPIQTQHGHGFNAETPTNIIGQQYQDHAIDPGTKRRNFFIKTAPNPHFKIPAACPHKDKH